MNASDTGVTMPLAATQYDCQNLSVRATPSLQSPRLTFNILYLLWLGEGEMFAVTQLNGDLGSNIFPDRSIGEQHTSIIFNTGRKFLHGISTQPPILHAISDSWMCNISANERDPYKPPIASDISIFDDVEVKTIYICILTCELFSGTTLFNP